jgi:hypothetical protein
VRAATENGCFAVVFLYDYWIIWMASPIMALRKLGRLDTSD